MDDEPHVLGELCEYLWSQLRSDLADVEPQEIDWRPLPQANSLNDIVRHLRIEAQWQLASIEDSERMLLETTTPIQGFIDSIPFDFERNRTELEELCIRFLAALRSRSLVDIEHQNLLVYRDLPGPPPPPHFLGYHHAIHLAMHHGQIRTIRNL